MNTSRYVAFVGVIAIALSVAVATPAAEPYTLYDVGKLSDPTYGEGSYGVGTHVAANGEVFGQSDIPGGLEYDAKQSYYGYTDRVFRWDVLNGIRDIGTLEPMGATIITDANRGGTVVGYCAAMIAEDADRNGLGRSARAFVWDAANGIRALPKFEQIYGAATAINATGQIVGWGLTWGSYERAVLWNAGDSVNVVDMGTLGGPFSLAMDINDSGQAVGVSQRIDEAYRGFLWDAVNGMRELDALTGHTYAEALRINNQGLIAGNSSYSLNRAVIWAPTKSGVEAEDLGSLGGEEAQSWIIAGYVFKSLSVDDRVPMIAGDLSAVAQAVNENGLVVGVSETQNMYEEHAFAWDEENGMRDLGTLGGDDSMPLGLNNHNQVVGQSDLFSYTLEDGEGAGTYARKDTHAVLWNISDDKAIDMIDLNTYVADSGWTLTTAVAITDDEDIVGQGIYEGKLKAFLLKRKRYTLNMNVLGTGSVTPGVGSHTFVEGTVVSLVATPGNGWSFLTWQGDLSSTASSTTITMDGDKTITAVFDSVLGDAGLVKLTTLYAGNGTVSPPGITWYLGGNDAEVYAQPDEGWSFCCWDGDVSGSNNPIVIKMTEDKVAKANFVPSGAMECPQAYATAASGQGSLGLLLGVLCALLVLGCVLRLRRRRMRG